MKALYWFSLMCSVSGFVGGLYLTLAGFASGPTFVVLNALNIAAILSFPPA